MNNEQFFKTDDGIDTSMFEAINAKHDRAIAQAALEAERQEARVEAARQIRAQKIARAKHREHVKKACMTTFASVIAASTIVGNVVAINRSNAEAFKRMQQENIEHSTILKQNGIEPDDINFSLGSMEFAIGDTEYELNVNAVDLDGEGPYNYDGGIYKGRSTTKCQNGDTIKSEFSVKTEEGDKSDTGISIDEALNRLGYND